MAKAKEVSPVDFQDVDFEKLAIGFNRINFIHKIFEPDFNANVRKCAEALGIRPNYLRDIIMNPNRDAGTKTLTLIYRYCMRTGRDPKPFIFVERDV